MGYCGLGEEGGWLWKVIFCSHSKSGSICNDGYKIESFFKCKIESDKNEKDKMLIALGQHNLILTLISKSFFTFRTKTFKTFKSITGR